MCTKPAAAPAGEGLLREGSVPGPSSWDRQAWARRRRQVSGRPVLSEGWRFRRVGPRPPQRSGRLPRASRAGSAHRPCPIEEGWLYRGQLVCPWHGSRFDPDGGTATGSTLDHHAGEEETEMFPHVKSALSAAELDEIGRDLHVLNERLHSSLPANTRLRLKREVLRRV